MASANMRKLMYAMKNDGTGKMVHIDSVQRGLECNCVCPECQMTLIAKKGSINVAHFAHYKNDKIVKNCERCIETSLHRMAKQILAENSHLILPEYKEKYPGTNNPQIIVKDNYDFKYGYAFTEKRIDVEDGFFIPDIVIGNDRIALVIEIVVTHDIDDAKLKKIKAAGISTIRIDLADIGAVPVDKLEEILISNTERKSWVYNKTYSSKLAREQAECKRLQLQGDTSKECPKMFWNGKYISNMVVNCCNCRFCKGITNGFTYCSYSKENNDILNNEDREVIEFEVCPRCRNSLRVSGATKEEPYLFCKECSFWAGIKLINGELVYKDRYDKVVYMRIPNFVYNRIDFAKTTLQAENECIKSFDKEAKCPYCGNELIIRKGKYGPFIACSFFDDFVGCNFRCRTDWNNLTVTFKKKSNPKVQVTLPIPKKLLDMVYRIENEKLLH